MAFSIIRASMGSASRNSAPPASFLHAQGPAVHARDLRGDPETQAIARIALGAEEGLEDLLPHFLGHTGAGVLHLDQGHHPFATHPQRDARVRAAGHRIGRVGEQVHQHLPEQRGLAIHRGQLGVSAHQRGLVAQLRLHQREGQVRLVGQIDGPPLPAREPRAIAHRLEDVAHALEVDAQLVQPLAEARRIFRQHLHLHEERIERIR